MAFMGVSGCVQGLGIHIASNHVMLQRGIEMGGGVDPVIPHLPLRFRCGHDTELGELEHLRERVIELEAEVAILRAKADEP